MYIVFVKEMIGSNLSPITNGTFKLRMIKVDGSSSIEFKTKFIFSLVVGWKLSLKSLLESGFNLCDLEIHFDFFYYNIC